MHENCGEEEGELVVVVVNDERQYVVTRVEYVAIYHLCTKRMILKQYVCLPHKRVQKVTKLIPVV